MQTAQVETLEPARFAPFGSYANLIQPLGPQIGASPITFYRDMLPLELAGKNPSFCVCRIEPRAGVIDVMEYHSSTGEGILPLDGDVLVQVAPATPRDAAFPAEEVRVFHVPRGTMLCLRPGAWHHAPFALEDLVNVLIDVSYPSPLGFLGKVGKAIFRLPYHRRSITTISSLIANFTLVENQGFSTKGEQSE